MTCVAMNQTREFHETTGDADGLQCGYLPNLHRMRPPWALAKVTFRMHSQFVGRKAETSFKAILARSGVANEASPMLPRKAALTSY